MAPYFEQYKSALKRGVEKDIASKKARIVSIGVEIDRLNLLANVSQQEIDALKGPLSTFDHLPVVNICTRTREWAS